MPSVGASGYDRWIVTAFPSTSRSGTLRWSRVRGIGAVAGVAVLLGSATLAPLSMPNAFASDGSGAFAAARTQSFAAADSAEPVIDLGVSDIERVGAVNSAAKSPSKQLVGAPLYTLAQFMFSGAVEWGGYKFTYYSQQVLPGQGLEVPGRHVNEDGYVSDGDGFVVLAGSAPKGTVFPTPFGYQGKIYDRGTVGNHLDVYIR